MEVNVSTKQVRQHVVATIIKESDGSYTVYQDSIGYTIFGLYAKNIWGQASAPQTPKIEK